MNTVEETKEALEHARNFQSAMQLLGIATCGTAMGYSVDIGEYVAGIYLAIAICFYIYAWRKEIRCKKRLQELSIV